MTALLTRRVLPKDAATVRADLESLASAVSGGQTLGLGGKGAAVKALQSHLLAAGLFKGPVTGTFDSTTEAALKAFQSAKNLSATGQVDAASLKQLRTINRFVKDGFETRAKEGERGKDIRSAEAMLAKIGFLKKSEVDGVFDRQTTKAVLRYRKHDRQVGDGHERIGKIFYKQLSKAAEGYGATLSVATVNDDFYTPKRTNLPRIKTDVILAQETKAVDARKEMSDKYGVHQNMKSDALAGSTVAWNKKAVDAHKRGLTLGVRRQKGDDMLDRWITWTDVSVGDAQVRMMSAHRPPARHKNLWPAFDANLARFVRNTKGPVVIGIDANQKNPQALAKKLGLVWHSPGPNSIDGFFTSPGIKVDHIRRLPKGSSDHHPVTCQIHLPKKLRKD